MNKDQRIQHLTNEKNQLGTTQDQQDRFVTALHAEKAKLVTNFQAVQSQNYNLHQVVAQLQQELEKERKRVAAVELAYKESLEWNDQKDPIDP